MSESIRERPRSRRRSARPERADEQPGGRGGRSDPRSWAGGGSTVRSWDLSQLGWAVIALGVALVASRAVALVVPGEAGSWLAQLVLWVVLGAMTVGALLRSRPRGLLRFSPVDLLYGIVLGVALRVVQGWLFVATGGPAGFPSVTSLAGGPGTAWWLSQLAAAGVVAPIVEESFFRGVVLVTLFAVVRRALRGRAGAERLAGLIAIVVSTALFVVAHLLLGASSAGDTIALTLVGLVNGCLVVLTRRLWGAVAVHMVYNALDVGLLYIGTTFG